MLEAYLCSVLNELASEYLGGCINTPVAALK